jgi:L-histidine N-alpha-methyltransferase
VLRGFADTRRRAIPARWFYDRRGSELFEADHRACRNIIRRASKRKLLEAHCPDVARSPDPAARWSSSDRAPRQDADPAARVDPGAYVPIDISGAFLRESAAALSRGFPGLRCCPSRPISPPDRAASQRGGDLPKLGFFPGSTIGNMIAGTSVDLLRAMRESLGVGSLLLIGMDRIKGEDVLVPAYDDAQGVTAAFNLNLLDRINRELDGTIPVDAFRHRAIWNDLYAARIEMHLEAVRDVTFGIEGAPFSMKAGETIHTENSHKYGQRDARILLRAGGWTPIGNGPIRTTVRPDPVRSTAGCGWRPDHRRAPLSRRAPRRARC